MVRSSVWRFTEVNILCQQPERGCRRSLSRCTAALTFLREHLVLLVFLNEAFGQNVILSDGSLGSWVDEKRGKTR